MDYTQDGSKLITGGQDFTLRVYDDETKKLVKEFPGENSSKYVACHSNSIFSIKTDPLNENMVYSGGHDRVVILSDLREDKAVSHISGPMLTGDTLDVYDYYLLTGSYRSENPLEIWDVRNTEEPLWTVDWKPDNPKKSGMILSSKFGKPSGQSVVAAGAGEN